MPFVDSKVTVGAHLTRDICRDSVQHGKTNGVASTNSKLRKWLSVTPSGMASTLELSKIRVHHKLGIQLRDLRLLDPMLAASYPSAILCRDRCLVINLEFIKMIVTLNRVFITNLDDPNANMFIEELQRRLKHPAGSATAMGVTPSTAALGALLHTPSAPLNNHSERNTDHLTKPNHHPTATHSSTAGTPANSSSHPILSSVHHPDLLGPHFEELSFDLRVLECALDVVSGYLENQAADLEAAAHPALDALTIQISSGNLERVRRIKNRMVRLMTRSGTVKNLLEELLNDDSDMKNLNLAAKEVEREELIQRQSLRHSISLSNSTPFDVPIPIHHRNNSFVVSQEQSAAAAPAGGGGGAIPAAAAAAGAAGTPTNLTAGGGTQPAPPPNNSMHINAINMLTQLSYKTLGMENDGGSSEDNSSDEGVEVVEQLVEAYFMVVDNTCNKLQTLAEYIDDTEDFINIELDSHRNQLIRLDLVLTSLTTSIGLITAITGLFAMNVTLSPDFDKAPYSWFVTISVASSVLAVVVFVSVMSYCRYKRLI